MMNPVVYAGNPGNTQANEHIKQLNLFFFVLINRPQFTAPSPSSGAVGGNATAVGTAKKYANR